MPQRGADCDIREPSARSGIHLTALIARGDRRALGEFYEQWFDRLFARARSLTGRDESFCLDVVQEAMLRVAKSMRPMQTDDDLARWMNRVVHTTALDLLRREARRTARHQRAGKAADTETRQHLDEQIAWLRRQLAELPADEHGLLWMRYALGSTLAAAGELTGITGDAAHGRLRRTLARLRSTARENRDD